MGAAPGAHLSFVVGVVRAGVPEVDLARPLLGANVGLPEIAVDQHGLDRTAVGSESVEEARDQLVQGDLDYVLVKLPVSAPLQIE